MKLLHLYYDLMNLYGEYANMAVLASRLKGQGLEITVDRKTLGDAFDCSQYDFIYLGAGMESSQKAALSDLLPHRGELASAIGQGSVLLFTGNAFEFLGSSITNASGREYPALGFSKFTVQETDTRITGDVICQCAQIKEPVVGFVNKCTLIKGIEAPLFTVSMGPGNQAGDPREGLCLGNVFGTHLTGPILVKNPSFLDYITDLLGKRQQPQFELSPMDNPHPLRAYEITLQELTKRRDGV